jgi:hypothetical protein
VVFGGSGEVGAGLSIDGDGKGQLGSFVSDGFSTINLRDFEVEVGSDKISGAGFTARTDNNAVTLQSQNYVELDEDGEVKSSFISHLVSTAKSNVATGGFAEVYVSAVDTAFGSEIGLQRGVTPNVANSIQALYFTNLENAGSLPLGAIVFYDSLNSRGAGDAADYSATKQALDYVTKMMLDGLKTEIESKYGNGLIQTGTYSQAGNDITVNPNWIWRISNVTYQKLTTTLFSIPVADPNFTRIDLVSGNNLGEVIITQGTAVEDPSVALPPSVPANNVGLFLVFVSNSGITSFENFAISSFVRFDISNQLLSAVQRQNARANIQALSRDTNDTRTGTLTHNGSMTVNGSFTQQGRPFTVIFTNDTASANGFVIRNTVSTNPGGLLMQERGSTIIRARGDSVTGYYILKLQNNNSTATDVFAVLGTDGYTEIGRSAVPVITVLLRVFGKVAHADATNADESATLGQVNSLIAAVTPTIPEKSITNAKLADVPTNTIKGRVTAEIGEPEDLTPAQVRTLLNVADGANNYTHPNHTGDVTSTGDGVTVIANNAVTNSKIANGTIDLTTKVTGSLPVTNGGTGRNTSTTAYGIIAAGTTPTGVQQTISPGTAGQALISNGASALPTFQNLPSGVSFVSVPVNKTATGSIGQFAKDADFLYVCTATNEWERIAYDQSDWDNS